MIDLLTVYVGKIFHFPPKPARVRNTLERSRKLQIDRPYKLFENRINDSVWKQLEEDVKSRNFKLKLVYLIFGIKKMSCYFNIQKPGTVTWRSFIGDIWEGTSECYLACQREKKREIFTRASSPLRGFTKCQCEGRTPPGTLQSQSLTWDWWVSYSLPASI